MRKPLALLATTTALTFAIGVSAWSALRTPPDGEESSFTAFVQDGAESLEFLLVSDDDDDDRRRSSRRDDDDDDDDGDDDDDHNSGPNPAPAKSVASPQNPLFGNGVAPHVQVN